MKINIAIDGPGAAGKSTIAKLLAKQLGYVHLDTGAMYRCCAYCAFINNINIDDEDALKNMLDSINISFDEYNHVFINGNDVSVDIRSNENGMRASRISQKRIVREKLVSLQQEIAKTKGFILDGRDIGTVVLKDAELKIYLVASVKSRAERRFKELKDKGIEANFEEIANDLEERDYQDVHRKESPLQKASDAIEVDTSDLDINEVTNAINQLLSEVIESR